MVAQYTLTALLSVVCFFVLFSKLYFLAKTPLGWFLMVANVPYEAFCRGRRKRWHADIVFFAVFALCWLLLWGPWAGFGWASVFGLAWVHALLTDLKWRNGVLTVQDARFRGKIPLPIPKLIVNLRGPVLSRGRSYELGCWPAGRAEPFEFLILNPADKVHCQYPFQFELSCSDPAVRVEPDPSGSHAGPDSGELARRQGTPAH